MSLSSQLISLLNSNEFGRLLEALKTPEINQQVNIENVSELVVAVASSFQRCVNIVLVERSPTMTDEHRLIFDELISECCRLLRNSCAVGRPVQMQIADFKTGATSIFDGINLVMFDSSQPQPMLSPKTGKMCWQLLANLGVQNEITQSAIWSKCIEPLLGQLQCVCDTKNSRECTTILYNLLISEQLSADQVKTIAENLLHCILDGHDLRTNDFHQLFLEHLITKYRSAVSIYDRIRPAEKRLHLIYYIADHMKAVCHEPISVPLMQFISKEFKKKSDCVLKCSNPQSATMNPKEVMALLEVLAQASSDERYSPVLAGDLSLFINVGCLLKSLHAFGLKQMTEPNIFAPVQKLDQLAPNSTEDSSIERDVSYQLKSVLIRTVGNLAYKNKTNQDMAREMEFIMTVLDSTSLDARNPLIKEWSILAIRNLCEGNEENQHIIRQLTKVGESQSDIIKELNLDMGSLRISSNVENTTNTTNTTNSK